MNLEARTQLGLAADELRVLGGGLFVEKNL
jgi:hypothetical protein